MAGYMLIVALIISITCGMVTGKIANAKGKSDAWFFVGLLFGPLGVLAALVISKDDDALAQQGVISGENRKCPFCAEIVKAEASICKHCGKDLPAAIITGPSKDEAANEPTRPMSAGEMTIVIILCSILCIGIVLSFWHGR